VNCIEHGWTFVLKARVPEHLEIAEQVAKLRAFQDKKQGVTSQDFNGDIALIACFAASWTPAMIRRWNADPFGFLRPWNEVPALMGSAPPATPSATARAWLPS
jgi:hypothetical protein